jgi:hypothetical protein
VQMAMGRRGTAGIIAAVLAGALAMAAPASAGEDLISYQTKGKMKPSKRIAYQVVCTADCQVTATSTLVLPGPNLGPVSVTGAFAAGQVAEAYLKPNKPARDAIKDNIAKAKLRTEVTATNVATGETDTDKRTFKFKR